MTSKKLLAALCRLTGITRRLKRKIAELEAKPNKRLKEWGLLLNLKEILMQIEHKD